MTVTKEVRKGRTEGREIKISEFCPEAQANLSASKAVNNCAKVG
jgi:hypothetical protein